MVSDPSTDAIVRWSDDGASFLVLDEFAFAKQLLPAYFRHKNFSSFVRQLNFYNFHKRQQDGKYTRLQHPFFKRGQVHLLSRIKRKTTHDATQSVKFAIAALTSQVKELKTQYEDLFKIQQQILYIFSRYMRAHPPATEGRLPRVIAGGRERLMLRGAAGAAGGAHLSPIDSEDGDSDLQQQPLHPHPNVEVLEDGAEDDEQHDAHITELKEGDGEGEEGVDDFDADEAELMDDEDGEEHKEHTEATAQAFAELQSLQDMISQLPGRQTILSSIPTIPLPPRPPRTSSAASSRSTPPANTTPAAPLPPTKLTLPTPAATIDFSPSPSGSEPYVFEPPSPSSTLPTYNAFADISPTAALPPMYPTAAHVTPPTSARSSRPNPKLLYSQEHYAKMEHSGEDAREQGAHTTTPASSSLPSSAPANGQHRVQRRTDAHPTPSAPPPPPSYQPPSPPFAPSNHAWVPTSPLGLPTLATHYFAQPLPTSSSTVVYTSPPLTPTAASSTAWMGAGPGMDEYDMSGYGGGEEGWGGGGGRSGSGGGGGGEPVGLLGHLRADSGESADGLGQAGTPPFARYRS